MTDWQKGDLALCVKGGTFTRAGAVYTVRKIIIPGSSRITDTGEMVRQMGGWISFLFEGVKDEGVSAAAERFRKVTPPKADEFDREVIDLMAGKKVPA